MERDGSATSLSAQLVADNRDALTRACGAQFMTDIGSGTLGMDTFRTYLAIERHFVVESARLLSAAALWSPDEATLSHHVDAAHHLIHDQLRFFSETFESVGCPGSIPEKALDRASVLAGLAREVIASGDYWRVIILSFATEHMYLSWCDEAIRTVDRSSEIGRWVAMHTTDGFRDRVRYLAEEVDRSTSAELVDQADRLYRDVIEAEVRFHEAPYLSPRESQNSSSDQEDNQT